MTALIMLDILLKISEDIMMCSIFIAQKTPELVMSVLSQNVLIGITLAGITVILWYYLFWKPFDWYRDLTELGFDDINRSGKLNRDSRRDAINDLRRKRQIGDLPPVYPNGWFVVLESDELLRGGVKELYVFGMNLVAWRGQTGKAYVADAYCPHLGAHLGVGGRVSGECIECPFHGWRFQGSDGALSSIPYSDTALSAKIKMWTITEMNGFIYMWYHAEGDEPSWTPEKIPEIESGEWIYRGRSEFKVGCHIQEIPENGSDMAHLNVVHDKAMMCGGEPEYSFLKWDFIKHAWLNGTWKTSEEPGEKHVAIMGVEHQMCLFNKFPILNMKVKVKQVGPGTVSLMFHTIFGPGILFHTVTPIEPLVQKVLHRFYSAKAFIHPYGKLILLGEAIMIERDIRIWNRKMFISTPILTKEDKLIKSFRRWYSQFYSENSPRHYFSKNDNNANTLEF